MSIRFRVFCLAVLVFVGACFCFVVPRMAEFLVVDQAAEPVDVMIVLSGGKGRRVKKAVDLYQAGFVDQMVMTGSGDPYYGVTTLDLMKNYALSLGVPEEAILLEFESQSTLDHMLNLRDWVVRNKWRRVMIVTSAFHTARSERVFRKGWADLSVEIIVVAAPDHIDLRHWWRHYEMCETVLSEWFRYVLYLFRV